MNGNSKETFGQDDEIVSVGSDQLKESFGQEDEVLKGVDQEKVYSLNGENYTYSELESKYGDSVEEEIKNKGYRLDSVAGIYVGKKKSTQKPSSKTTTEPTTTAEESASVPPSTSTEIPTVTGEQLEIKQRGSYTPREEMWHGGVNLRSPKNEGKEFTEQKYYEPLTLDSVQEMSSSEAFNSLYSEKWHGGSFEDETDRLEDLQKKLKRDGAIPKDEDVSYKHYPNITDPEANREYTELVDEIIQKYPESVKTYDVFQNRFKELNNVNERSVQEIPNYAEVQSDSEASIDNFESTGKANISETTGYSWDLGTPGQEQTTLISEELPTDATELATTAPIDPQYAGVIKERANVASEGYRNELAEYIGSVKKDVNPLEDNHDYYKQLETQLRSKGVEAKDYDENYLYPNVTNQVVSELVEQEKWNNTTKLLEEEYQGGVPLIDAFMDEVKSTPPREIKMNYKMSSGPDGRVVLPVLEKEGSVPIQVANKMLQDPKYDNLSPGQKQSLASYMADIHWESESLMPILKPIFNDKLNEKGMVDIDERTIELQSAVKEGTLSLDEATKQLQDYYSEYNKLYNESYKEAVEAAPPKPTLVEGSLDYIMKEGLNQNTIGLAYQALSDGKKFFDTYGYKPSMTEEIGAGVVSFIADPLMVVGGGAATKGAAWTLAKAGGMVEKNLVKSGMSKTLAKKYSEQWMKARIGNVSRVAGGAGGMGAWKTGNDILMQKIQTNDWSDVELSEAFKHGAIDATLGAGIGMLGIGATKAEQIVEKSMNGGMSRVINYGAIKPAEFVAENVMFVKGGAAMRGEEATMDDLIHSFAFLGTMKLKGGLASKLKSYSRVSRGFDIDKVNKGVYEVEFNNDELSSLGMKGSTDQIIKTLRNNPKEFSRVMLDKNVPQQVKDKIMWSASGTFSDGQYQAEKIEVDELEDGRSRMRLVDANGQTIDLKTFENESAANHARLVIEDRIREDKNRKIVQNLSSKEKIELEKSWAKKKYNEDEVFDALNVSPELRSKKQIQIVEELYDSVNEIVEKRKPEEVTEPVSEEITERKESKPEVAKEPIERLGASVEEKLGSQVVYNGERGVLKQAEDGSIIVETKDKEIEVADSQKDISKTLDELGVEPTEQKVRGVGEKKVSIDGEEYEVVRPITDTEGNVKAYELRDSQGNTTTTKRPKIVEQIELEQMGEESIVKKLDDQGVEFDLPELDNLSEVSDRIDAGESVPQSELENAFDRAEEAKDKVNESELSQEQKSEMIESLEEFQNQLIENEKLQGQTTIEEKSKPKDEVKTRIVGEKPTTRPSEKLEKEPIKAEEDAVQKREAKAVDVQEQAKPSEKLVEEIKEEPTKEKPKAQEETVAKIDQAIDEIAKGNKTPKEAGAGKLLVKLLNENPEAFKEVQERYKKAIAEGKKQRDAEKAEIEASTKSGIKAAIKIKAQNIYELDNIVDRATTIEQKEALKGVKSAVIALSKLDPETKFVIHETKDSFINQMKKYGSDASGTEGGFFDNGREIHINAEGMKNNTVWHESGHKVIASYLRRSPDAVNRFNEQLRKSVLSAKEYAEYRDKFDPDAYSVKELPEEIVVEWVADVATGKYNLENLPKSRLNSMINYLKNIAKRLGYKPSDIELTGVEDVREFAKKLNQSFNEGRALKLSKNVSEGKVYEQTIVPSTESKVPKGIKQTGRGPKLQKVITEEDLFDWKDIEGKPMEFIYYDNMTSDMIEMHNDKLGYTVFEKGEGGPGYSFRTPIREIGAVGAVTNLNAGIKTLNHLKNRELISKEKPLTGILLQNKESGHLGNPNTLDVLYGTEGHLVKMIEAGVPEKDIVKVLKEQVKAYNNLSWRGASIKGKIDIKPSDIKSIEDFYNIMAAEGFGKRGIWHDKVSLNKQDTRFNKNTPEWKKILYGEWMFPAKDKIAEHFNESYTADAQPHDIVKVVDIDTERLGVSDPKLMNSESVKAAKKAGISVELIPESAAHKSYPVVFFGKNVGIPKNFVSVKDINPIFEKDTFYKAGRRGSESPEIRIPETAPTEKAPKLQKYKERMLSKPGIKGSTSVGGKRDIAAEKKEYVDKRVSDLMSKNRGLDKATLEREFGKEFDQKVKPKFQKVKGDKESFKDFVKTEEDAIRKNKIDIDDFMEIGDEMGLSLRETLEAYQEAVDEMKIFKRQPTTPGPSVSEGRASKIDPEGYKKLKDGIREANRLGKAEAKGKRAGKAETKKDVRQVRDQLQTFISENAKDINKMGKNLSAAMLRKIGRIGDNEARLRDAQDYINRMVEDSTARQKEVDRLNSLSKLEKSTNPKNYITKGGKTPKAKTSGPTPEVIEKMNKINAAIEQGKTEGGIERAAKETEEILERIEEGKYTTDEALEADLERLEDLSYVGIHESPKEIIDSKLEDIQETIKRGKDINKIIREQKKLEQQERLSNTKIVIDPESKAKMTNEEKHMVPVGDGKAEEYKVKKKRVYDLLKQDSWYSLLDKLSVYDKKSGMFNSYISNELGGMTASSEILEGVRKREMSNMTSSKLSEIYKKKKPSEVKSILEDNSKLNDYEYIDESGKKHSINISQNMMYKKYQELQDPSLNETHFENGYKEFDQSTGRYVLSKKGQFFYDNLKPEVKEWADWQLEEFYPWVHSVVNPTYKRLNGINLPKNDMYSPIFRQGIGKELNEADLFSSEPFRRTANNGSLISRLGSKKDLKWIDGDQVMYQYFDKMNFYTNWAETIKDLDRVFSNESVQASIKQLHGQEYLDTIRGFLDDFARKNIEKRYVNDTMDSIRKNLTTATLSVKPSIAIKQLTSIPAYASFVPVSQFAKYSAEFWKNPKKNWDLLMESDYVKNRYDVGFERDIMMAMAKDAQSMMSKKSNFKDQLMFMTKWGDRAAIITGGYAVYKHKFNEYKKQGMSESQAKKAAMNNFEMATRLTQQATASSDLSEWQRAGSIHKLLTMYMTSPMQYHRMASSGMRNLVKGRGSKTENLKAIAIYHFLLPQLFSAVSTALPRAIQGSEGVVDFATGGGLDDEDIDTIIQNQLTAAAIGNFNSLVVLGDVAEYLVGQLGESVGKTRWGRSNFMKGYRGFDYQPSPFMKEVFSLGRGVGKTTKEIEKMINGKDIKMEDVIEAADLLAVPILKASTGLPVDMAKGAGNLTIDALEEEMSPDETTRVLLGFSDWSAGDKKKRKTTTSSPKSSTSKLFNEDSFKTDFGGGF